MADLPPVVPLGSAVLISGTALIQVQYALRIRRAVLARDGIHRSQLPAVLDDLEHAIRAAAANVRMSASGHEDIDFEADPAPSAPGTDLGAWMTTAEAAARIGVSERQMSRYADQITSTMLSGRRLFDRAAVETYAAEHPTR